MTLYKGNKVIAGSRSYIGNIGDIKYTARTDLPYGGAWCNGGIKLKDEYPTVYQMLLDGKLQYVDIATYENVLSLNGSCGFFGLDTATESFRVPSLNDVYIKSGQVADEFGAESLPDHTHDESFPFQEGPRRLADTFGTSGSSGNIKSVTQNLTHSSLEDVNVLQTGKASLSDETYQDGAKVNPDHVQYRAYVVLYNGDDIKSDITKEYQLNNPFFFGMSQYFEVDPKNASWLKSDGAFHSGAVYESFYNWLVSEYENPDMLPRKVNVDIVGNPTISDWVASGFSDNDYFVCRTIPSNVTSLEICAKVRTGNSTSNTIEAIYGNSRTNRHTPQLTIDSGVFWFGLSGDGNAWTAVKSTLTPTRNKDYWLKGTWNGSQMELLVSEDGDAYTSLGTSALTSLVWDELMLIGDDATSTNWWNGLIYMEDAYVKVNGKMWWKGVGNAVRKVSEEYNEYSFVIDEENKSFRLPIRTLGDFIVEDFSDGINWYKVYNSGWVEQGGNVSSVKQDTYTAATVLLLKEYKDTNYTTVITQYDANQSLGISDAYGSTACHSKTTSSFVIGSYSWTYGKDWKTSGQGKDVPDSKTYFYVGDVVSDANLINAGKVLDLLAKLESYDYVVESKTATADDPRWYRVYKSGWVEQGGKYNTSTTGTATATISLNRTMKDVSYNIGITKYDTNSSASLYYGARVKAVTISQITVVPDSPAFYWTVSGQGA